MKLLINSSTLKGTGVVQVASSFINECKTIEGNEYIVFMSPSVSKNVKVETFPSNFKFYEFGKYSLYSIKGRADLKKMKQIESEEHPDAVFSVFGPSLWRPKAPHLMGFAYPYYVYHDSPLFDMLTLKEKMQARIKEIIHMYMLKHDGDYYVCETDDVAERLCSMYGINQNKVYRAYNTASSVFLDYKATEELRHDNEFRFFTLCSPYKHKNMAILNKVIPLLKQHRVGKDIRFYTTFSDKAFKETFDEQVRDYIVNVGPQSVSDCPKLISQCDALFLPTLLECYSASYPEAMCLRKPIITSDLPFATTVCKDSAIYFEPLNPDQITNVIVELVTNESKRKNLIEKGVARLNEFGTAHDRAELYVSICSRIIKNNVK